MSKVEIVMKKTASGLTPYGDSEWEKFDTIRTTKPVIVSVHQARNPEHTAKLWAIATRVANFDPGFEDAEDAIKWVKEQLGLCKRKVTQRRDGTVEIRIEYESIAEHAMDQITFGRFYDRALFLWAQRIGCDPEQLGREAA